VRKEAASADLGAKMGQLADKILQTVTKGSREANVRARTAPASRRLLRCWHTSKADQ
jgi:hypothetical protein